MNIGWPNCTNFPHSLIFNWDFIVGNQLKDTSQQGDPVGLALAPVRMYCKNDAQANIPDSQTAIGIVGIPDDLHVVKPKTLLGHCMDNLDHNV